MLMSGADHVDACREWTHSSALGQWNSGEEPSTAGLSPLKHLSREADRQRKERL